MQRLGGLSFGLPQPGQALGVVRPLGGFRRHRLHVVADGHLGIVEGEPRHRQRAFRRDPAQMEKHRFGLPDLLADVAVARRLPRLLLQRAELGVHRDDDVVQAHQVGFGGLQPQLRLVPAGVQAGDAGGFLQQHPPLGRLGVDDGADTALADQGRGVGAAGVVGEQQLHIARPHQLAVDAVVRSGAPLDPALDVQLVEVVEAGGGRAGRVVHA